MQSLWFGWRFFLVESGLSQPCIKHLMENKNRLKLNILQQKQSWPLLPLLFCYVSKMASVSLVGVQSIVSHYFCVGYFQCSNCTETQCWKCASVRFGKHFMSYGLQTCSCIKGWKDFFIAIICRCGKMFIHIMCLVFVSIYLYTVNDAMS